MNGNYFVEVKDKRYIIHPTEKILLKLRGEPKSLRTQYQVKNQTQIGKNQKVIRTNIDEKVAKKFSKKQQPNIHQQKSNLPSCPTYKKN